MKLFLRMLMGVLFLLVMASVVMAQDTGINQDDAFADVERITYVDPDPIAVTDLTNDETIEAITDDSESYYGAVVTLEGQVSNFISPRIFEVGEEDELFTNSFVLAVNNSAEALPTGLVEEARVRVTGRVHPSFDIINGGYNWTYNPFNDDVAADTVQEDASRMNMVNFVQNGYVPEAFGQHTILEILNVENIEILGYDDLLTVD